ncbi:hypothetical protein [Chitinophaga vietnamensis]|uniref:hypothetical protein n=1 Tax=Chitinophaga vietnamensis TaxID=2593957 RepID=UPI0011777D62|nr:hypothetical protein [Chitinophaga vietnamensis]
MKTQHWAGLLLLAAGISSCSKHIYVPNTANVPLLKEKYEFKGSISPTNLQTAFALTNNIAIMANGQYVYRYNFDKGSNNNNDLFLDNDTRGGVIEGAVGYFKPLDAKKRMVLDVFAGYGGGGFRTLDKNYSTTAGAVENDYLLRNHFSKVFIQPSIGFVHPVFEAAFTSRFSFVNFYNMYIGPKAFQNDAASKENFSRINDKPVAFYEPAFTFRAGYKYVKFQMQVLFSVVMDDNAYNNSNYKTNEYFQPVAVGLGAAFDIGHWYDDFRKKR